MSVSEGVHAGLVHLELWHLPPCPTTSEPHLGDCKVPPHEVEFDLNKHVRFFEEEKREVKEMIVTGSMNDGSDSNIKNRS